MVGVTKKKEIDIFAKKKKVGEQLAKEKQNYEQMVRKRTATNLKMSSTAAESVAEMLRQNSRVASPTLRFSQ